jgi:hypothetical protein
MSEFYNATDAASIIGISYKTILRRLEDNKIEAVKGEDGQYSIADAEVERLRILQLTCPRPVKSIGAQSSQDQSILERLADLEERVRSLETKTSQDRTPEKPHTPLYRYIVDREDIAPQQEPSIRATEPSRVPADIPHGSIMMADFAAQHGVNRSSFLRHCTQGYRDDPRVETIERPKPGGQEGHKERWLSPQQQREAIAFWRRNKVAFGRCGNAECACKM